MTFISIIIIIIITTICMVVIFYTHNQYNYLITYYLINCSFEYCLLAEHLLLPC